MGMRKFRINVNGISYDVEVEELGGAVYAPAPAAAPAAPAPVAAAAPAAAPVAPAATPAPSTGPVEAGTQIKSPMPGTILDIKVSVGDAVKEGDVLMILEAMKMENEIQAPLSGKVVGVHTTKGATVNATDLLVVIA